jgi:NAD(P)-dependent dehydrogenase (short-subunit alcohol dehydrogenase family)
MSEARADRTASLAARVAIVTGAERSIAFDVASHFIAAGVHVFVCAVQEPVQRAQCETHGVA